MTRSWLTTTVRHGSASGYRLHQELGEDPCPACYEAKAEYDKRRKAAPVEANRSRWRARAQGKAYGRLARAHKREYDRYYREELDKIEREEGTVLP